MASFVRSEQALNCFDFDNIHNANNWNCRIGDDSSDTASFFVVGDSHGLSVFDAFHDAGRLHGYGGYFSGASGCIPLLGVFALRDDNNLRNCNIFNRRIFDFVKSEKIDLVILVARWTYYTNGGYHGDNFSYIGLSENDKKSESISKAAFRSGLRETIAAYTEIGVKVRVVRQIPQQLLDPQEIYAMAYRNEDPHEALRKLSVGNTQHNSLQEYVDFHFIQAMSKNELFSYHDVAIGLCEQECMVGTDTESYYFDDDHLSVSGAKLIEKPVSEWLFALLQQH